MRVMARGRRRDHHRIDVVPRDERREVVDAAQAGMVGACRRQPIRIEIAQRRDPRAGESAERPQQILAPVPDSHDGDARLCCAPMESPPHAEHPVPPGVREARDVVARRRAPRLRPAPARSPPRTRPPALRARPRGRAGAAARRRAHEPSPGPAAGRRTRSGSASRSRRTTAHARQAVVRRARAARPVPWSRPRRRASASTPRMAGRKRFMPRGSCAPATTSRR